MLLDEKGGWESPSRFNESELCVGVNLILSFPPSLSLSRDAFHVSSELPLPVIL